MKSNLICYCFGYSQQDIEHDVMAHAGVSTILERIMAEKRSGGCACAQMHPLGR